MGLASFPPDKSNGGDEIVKPNLREDLLRSKLTKGMGHNSYGEIAWPNDLLYMFPVCIVGTTGLATAFATSFPTELGEACDVFLTPEEILPEWFLLPTFQLLRAIPNKVLGITAMAAVPITLGSLPFVETVNPFANPIRRPVATLCFIVGFFAAILLGAASISPL